MPRILVIEDELPLCEEIANNLTFEGFDICVATNGATGISIAQNTEIDLILCDITMPEVSGYDVLAALHEHAKTALIPFIFVTAQAGMGAIRKGMTLGADDYLIKPFTQAELLVTIRARLSRANEVKTVTESELVRAKQKFMNQIYHELRTPMTVISLAHNVLEVGLDKFSPDETRNILSQMVSGIGQLNKLVEQVTLRAWIDTGILTESYVREHGVQIESQTLISDAIHAARRMAQRNQDMVIHTQKFDEWITVWGVADLLGLALAEHISHAMNTSPNGSFISISQWKLYGYTSISIAVQKVDTLPKQHINAVPPFLPSEVERKGKDDVTVKLKGIGLPTAKTLIELHGGTLSIGANIEQDGLTIIRLPISAASASKASATAQEARQHSRQGDRKATTVGVSR